MNLSEIFSESAQIYIKVPELAAASMGRAIEDILKVWSDRPDSITIEEIRLMSKLTGYKNHLEAAVELLKDTVVNQTSA